MKISKTSVLLSVAPTIDTNIYADGDQLGSLMTLTGALDDSSGTGKISSVVVIDKDKEKSALDLLFFNQAPTITSVDNGALDISDAEMAAKFIGRVKVASADYVDLANSSEATVRNVGLLVKAEQSRNLYCILQSKGTPTYTAATDLQIKVGIEQD